MSLSRQQLTLIGIFAIFMGPVLLVMLMRSSWWQYQPSGLKNNGYLVQPPIELNIGDTETFERKWLVLHVIGQTCEQACMNRVTALRQVHRAAGRHGDQLIIVLLSESEFDPALRFELESIYPQFRFVADSTGDALKTLNTINLAMQDDQPGLESAKTYILDPNLNVILAYSLDANPNDIHKDLKRLLKWSDRENR